MDSQQSCSTGEKREQRQTIGRVDFRSSPYEHIVIIQLHRKPLQNCRLGVFQDAAFPEDVLDTLFLREEHLKHTTNKMDVKKQSVVSQSSAEAEVTSLDARFRMEGLPAHQFVERVVEGLSKPASTRNNTSREKTTFADRRSHTTRTS